MGNKGKKTKKGGNKALGIRLLSAVKRTQEPITSRDLMRRLNLPRARKIEVRQVLKMLVMDGKLAKGKDGYAVPQKAAAVTGRLIGHPDGYGFVVRDDGNDDVFIPRKEMRGAMHGDTVSIRVTQGRDGRSAGSVKEVIERGVKRLVGRLARDYGRWCVVPMEGRYTRPVWLSGKGEVQVREGDLVQVEITAYPDRGEALAGRVIQALGSGDDPAQDSDLVLASHDVDPLFPDAVAAAADALPQKISREHRQGRRDLRDLATVTIDGENARDFDDAVSLEAGENGAATLWVHIADVGHFAPHGSALDVEAEERATSIYLPDQVVPMFPEPLSNGICSLRPDEERLTLTVEMDFNRLGRCTRTQVYESVIKSDARLTYTEVNQMLVARNADVRDRYTALLPMLEQMGKLAKKRQKIRDQRGSLDFDLPEMMVVLGDGGEVREIIHQPREAAHRLIEEFMLVANESVAAWLTESHWPVVFRVHEEPDLDRLSAFIPVARNVLGPDVPIPSLNAVPKPKDLQGLLTHAQGHPAERVLNSLLIRSLKQARYTSENLGHYGLAAECYCHFTSPIRRYPDLMVHRLVKHRLKQGKWQELGWTRALESIATHASVRERRAVAIERRVIEIKKCRHLQEMLGTVCDAVVTSVARFGLFAELPGVGFEGLLHADNLPSPVVHDERHMALLVGRNGKKLQVGHVLTVKISHVDVLAGKVSLDLAD